MPMKVSVMITTKNRLRDLQRTVSALKALNPGPDEILITADGCTDRTVAFVNEEFAMATLIVNPVGRGSIASRDKMLRNAVGDLVLSLDDDSYPEQSDCIERLRVLFSERPDLAVAHFPQRSDEFPDSLGRREFGIPGPTRTFANCGACFRRSVYVSMAGFETKFFHAYEEPDYALQCVAAGYEVFFAPVITIRHHWTGQTRSELRTHQQHARNECWSTIMRCPFPYAPAMIVRKALAHFRFAVLRGPGWFLREPVWWWQAVRGLPYFLRKRQPVPRAGYRRWLRLEDRLWSEIVNRDAQARSARN